MAPISLINQGTVQRLSTAGPGELSLWVQIWETKYPNDAPQASRLVARDTGALVATKFLHLSSILGRKYSHEPERHCPEVTSLGWRANAAVPTLVRLTPDTTGRQS